MWCEHITDPFSYTYKRKDLNDEDSSEPHDGVSNRSVNAAHFLSSEI